MGKIIWYLILAIIIYVIFQAIQTWSQNTISYRYGSTEEFKERIAYTLNFIEKNYPDELKLIKENVRTIGEHDNKPSFSRGKPLGVSYARLEKGANGKSKGLIILLPITYHCPPDLINNRKYVQNCAGVIYHEALHHYHFNNNLFQSDPNLEHYHVYKRQYDFAKKMDSDKETLKWLNEQISFFKKQSKI